MAVDVLLVPVGLGRYELYSEPSDARPDPAVEATGGVWHRLVAKFRAVLSAIEREHGARPLPTDSGPRPGLAARVRLRFFCWLAERVAEQRLLWQLRGVGAARLRHPDDVAGPQAHRTLHGILKRDADRHFVWLVVHGLLFAASGVIAVVPGPNLIAYYFAFRLVGHTLSWRGARHGMRAVSWTPEPESALTELRRLAALPAAEREARVEAIAARLGAPRLPRFFLRTSASG